MMAPMRRSWARGSVTSRRGASAGPSSCSCRCDAAGSIILDAGCIDAGRGRGVVGEACTQGAHMHVVKRVWRMLIARPNKERRRRREHRTTLMPCARCPCSCALSCQQVSAGDLCTGLYTPLCTGRRRAQLLHTAGPQCPRRSGCDQGAHCGLICAAECGGARLHCRTGCLAAATRFGNGFWMQARPPPPRALPDEYEAQLCLRGCTGYDKWHLMDALARTTGGAHLPCGCADSDVRVSSGGAEVSDGRQ